MNHSDLSSTLLLNLVDNSKTNPYYLWPGITTQKATNFLVHQIIDDAGKNASFSFKKDETLYLYFQLQKLEWDSNHFGYNCWAIKHFYINDHVDFIMVNEMVEQTSPLFNNYIVHNNIYFLSADIPSQSKNGNYFIQLLGFKFILNWVDGFLLSKNMNVGNENLDVGTIRPEELDSICNIAAMSYYKGGRFYSDKRFSVSKVDNLYGAIIRNSFLNNDIVLVCRKDKKPIGSFVIKPYSIFSEMRVASIRFILLDPHYRGNSIGYRLFQATLDFLHDKCDLVTTGLESHNVVSLNLHIKSGFRFNYLHNAYHLWNKQSA